VVDSGLAASVATAVVRRVTGPARVLAAVSLLVGLVLFVTGDLHGGAAATGAGVGALMTPMPVPARSAAGREGARQR
jgi:hypothetical protein